MVTTDKEMSGLEARLPESFAVIEFTSPEPCLPKILGHDSGLQGGSGGSKDAVRASDFGVKDLHHGPFPLKEDHGSFWGEVGQRE